jgi:tetratricopeptide (TPR) repeat protein
LPGAYIPYSYEGDTFAFVETHTYVAEVGILVTDQNGRYRVPALFQTHSLFKTGAKLAIWPGYCPTTHSMFAPDSKTHKTVPPDNSNNPKAWADDFKGFCWRYSCWRDLTLGQATSPAQKKIQADLDAVLQSEQRLLDAEQRRLDEKNPDFLFNSLLSSGGLKVAQSNWDGALADYNRAIEIKPDSIRAYIARGEVKGIKGDPNGALADYNKAIELSPGSFMSYYLRGCVERAQGDGDGALDDFNKVIQLSPNYPDAYQQRGEVKKEKGDLDGAQADFKKAAELKHKYFQ